MNVSKIKKELFNLTAVEIEEVIVALKEARTLLSKRAIRKLKGGDRVMFTTNTGSVYRGFVVKKGIKYCRVRATLQDDAGYQRGGMSMWRVPAADLTVDTTALPARKTYSTAGA
tara:strand:+ start:196 stop:537 length:342 start_codon:yes stop_codon:yes gene_type:complete